MTPFSNLWRLKPALTRFVAAAMTVGTPITALAGPPDWSRINRYAISEPVSGIDQLSDLRPSDWAYQALRNLIERDGCATGFADHSWGGERRLTRFEAAALLDRCLGQVTQASDELKALRAALAPELAVMRSRIDGLEARVGALAAQQFSSTTKLSGQATMVVGGNGFFGSAINSATNAVNTTSQGALPLANAVSFNYDLQLTLDTSFDGADLLRTVLRSGNFDFTNNSFNGGGPTPLSTLEIAFQEPSGANIMGIYKLFYQAPLGSGFTLTLGPRVAQEDMLAYWPSSYPAASVLDVFTINGSPVATNYARGTGAGLWWQQNGWSVSALYVAQNGQQGTPASGGIGTANSVSSSSVQLAYHQDQWGIAAMASAVQNSITPYGTRYLLNQGLNGPVNNMTVALALNGTWQPANKGWIPSISAGWGVDSIRYAAPVAAGTPLTAQSWSVGLQWLDAFEEGNAAGMALGQAPFTTSQSGGGTPNDANWMWEWWYKFQLSDAISVTPAVFYLSRPLGQETPAGQSFNQLGALIKTQFSF